MKLKKLARVGALSLLLPTSLWGAVIFEDQFNTSPTGANRTIHQHANASSELATSPSWGPSGNTFLSTSALGQSNQVRLLTYSPTSLASSWEALAGRTTIEGTHYTTLNGGFSFFTRVNASDLHASRPDIHWLRPLDIAGTTINGVNSQAFRMILEGQSNGNLIFQLFTTGEKAFSRSASQPTNFDASGVTLAVPNFYEQLVPGSTWHLGFTFETQVSTGLVTLQLLGRQGEDRIDTTST